MDGNGALQKKKMVFVHFGSFWPIFDHFASFVQGGMPFYLENGHSLKGQTVCGYSKTSSLFTYYWFARICKHGKFAKIREILIKFESKNGQILKKKIIEI